MRRAAPIAPLLAALALAACGGKDEGEATPGARDVPDGPATADEARPAAPPQTTTGPGSEAGDEAEGGRPRGEDQPGGGTDANALVPAVYELGPDGALTPRTIGVPEFLGIRLVVNSTDDEAHRVELQVDPPVRLTVSPGGRASLDVTGQRAGRFALTVDGERAGTLEVGVEPGP